MGAPIPKVDRDELRRSHAATTQEKWRTGIRGYAIKTDDHIIASAPPHVYSHEDSAKRWMDNAEFCVDAHEAMPKLLDEVDALLAAVAEFGIRLCDDTCNGCDDPRRCWCGTVEHNAKVEAFLAVRR